MERPPAPADPGLVAIFAAFLRLGVTSFGGGTAGWIHHSFVLRRQWLDDHAFLAGLALGQIMPGSNGVNLTVLTGQRLRGSTGALAALLGLLSGPLVIVVGLAAGYALIAGIGWVHAALDGVAAGAIGLTFATGLRTLRRGTAGAGAFAVAAVTVLCVGVLRWPMLPVLLCLAPVSIGIAFLDRRHGHGRG
jgi:chromate transporter